LFFGFTHLEGRPGCSWNICLYATFAQRIGKPLLANVAGMRSSENCYVTMEVLDWNHRRSILQELALHSRSVESVLLTGDALERAAEAN